MSQGLTGIALPEAEASAENGACVHCGLPAGPGERFCCRGCAAAHALIHELGLSAYYDRRTSGSGIAPAAEDEVAVQLREGVVADRDGACTLLARVDGVTCGACVWLIESALDREPGVTARVNLSTRRLFLRWSGPPDRVDQLVARVRALGYRLAPYDPGVADEGQRRGERELLLAMAVAGFSAMNIMLLSVSVWSGHAGSMGEATRTLMHWLSALIALPTIAYCGRPFFRSALTALRAGRTNMDVPISVGVTLATGISLAETIGQGPHAYFDGAVMLLFFLLIGRYLDSRARGRARSAAEHLLALGQSAVTVLGTDGIPRAVRPAAVPVGATVLVSAGERIGVDGRILEGVSALDTALVTGETAPQPIQPGSEVFAGMVNLSAPIRVTVTAAGEGTLLAEIVRLMEVAERGRSRFVALADRVARFYTPVVHALALATFLVWTLALGLAWKPALLIAVAVLIITCPCALALAVPAVQVVACGRLLRRGILVKSGTALERLAQVDTIVFDKTGTLTLGRPELLPDAQWTRGDLEAAARLARASRHPLSRALARAAGGGPVAEGVVEIPGRGLEIASPLGPIRLGSRSFVGQREEPQALGDGPELWFVRPGGHARRFSFADGARHDAAVVVRELRRRGYRIELLSGDRAGVVAGLAGGLGIAEWRAGVDPAAKVARLAELRAAGAKVLMVGDGLNDAAALAAAHVSVSPATGADVAQAAADAVFQGDGLAPVVELLDVAAGARRLSYQNLALALLYNLAAVPLAMIGMVTPLIAAAAMSGSSLVVIGNALRLGRQARTGERA